MAELTRRIELRVYDKTMQQWLGTVPYDTVDLTQRDGALGVGTGKFTVAGDDPVLSSLLTPGARVQCLLRPPGQYGQDGLTWDQVFLSGRVVNPTGDLLGKGPATFEVEDDLVKVLGALAYVNPSGDPSLKAASQTDLAQTVWDGITTRVAGTVQGLLGRFQTALTSSPRTAVDVITELVQVNAAARWGAAFGSSPFVFTNDSVSGAAGADIAAILPSVRFQTIGQYAAALLSVAGVTMRAAQWNGQIRVSFRVPQNFSAPLTPESGAVQSGRWSIKSATANDVVVGGPGEEAARAFRHFRDGQSVADLGALLEVFRDQTSAPYPYPNGVSNDAKVAMYYHLRTDLGVTAAQIASFEADLTRGGAAAMADGAQTSSLSAVLGETPTFRFGGTDGYLLGDRAVVSAVAPNDASRQALTFSGTLSTINAKQNPDVGFQIAPQMGDPVDDPNIRIARAIAALAKANIRRATK